jgi:transcriptional regulator GlxA family with amidase domain
VASISSGSRLVLNAGAPSFLAESSIALSNQVGADFVGTGPNDHPSSVEFDSPHVGKPSGVGLASWRVKKAQNTMCQLMTQGCSIEHVAKECAMSRSHFSRAFKTATGLSPYHWLRRERLRKAEKLLMEQNLTLYEVALECGFHDQSHFSRVFRTDMGLSPRRWQLQSCRRPSIS